MVSTVHPRHLTALTPSDLTTLATLLSLPYRLIDRRTCAPSPLWLASQARAVARLPKPLRRPHDWLTRLTISANRRLCLTLDDLVPQCAVLCTSHADLNPWVVRRAFFLLSREVTGRLDALRSYLDRPGRYNRNSEKLNGDTVEEVRRLVHRLAGVVALWMAPAAVERMGLGRGELPPRIDSQCEACIVSALGADAQALCDLRTGLLGRSHKRRARPALLRLVEAWIARFRGEGRDAVVRESERLGKVVKRVRRAVHEVNKKQGKRMGGETAKRDAGHRSTGGGGVSSKSRSRAKKGSHGKQPYYSSSSSTSRASASDSSSNTDIITQSRHYHQRGGQSDNTASRPATVDDEQPLLRRQSPSCRVSSANTIDDIIDAYHGEDDVDADDDVEFDEVGPHAVDRLQRASSRWYDAFSDVSEQHPAFRQSAADIDSWWAKMNKDSSAGASKRSISPAATSAIPAPLSLRSKDSEPASLRIPFENDDEHDEEDDSDPFDLAQWTDVSVPTLATRSTFIAMGGARLSPAPTVPKVPSIFRTPFVFSANGSISVVRGDGRLDVPSSTDLASSVYSQDGTALPHPPASRVASRYMNPWAPPSITMRDDQSAALSQVTAWPGQSNYRPYQSATDTSAPSSPRRHAPSSSNRSVQTVSSLSNTSLSPGEFQSALDRLSLTNFDSEPGHDACGPGTTFGGHIPKGSVLPGDSVSVVGGMNSVP